MATLLNFWPNAPAAPGTDTISGANFTPMAGCSLHGATGDVIGLKNTGFLPLNFSGLVGSMPYVTANALETNIVSPGADCSLAFCFRAGPDQPNVSGFTGGCAIRFVGGRYIFKRYDGSIQFDASNSYNIVTAAEYDRGKWNFLALVRNGAGTDVWLNGVFIRTTPRQLVMPTAAMYLFDYDATLTHPGTLELKDIGIYSGLLSEAEILALYAGYGTPPANYEQYGSGSDFGAGCPLLENGNLDDSGNPMLSYIDQNTIGGRTSLRFTFNGWTCIGNWVMAVPDKTTLYTYCEMYIPSVCVMAETGSAPNANFNLTTLCCLATPGSTAAGYVFRLLALRSGTDLLYDKLHWYNAAGGRTEVAMDAGVVPRSEWFSIETYTEYNDANSVIRAYINGTLVVETIAADFTAKNPIRLAMCGPYMGTHIQEYNALTAPDNYYGIAKHYVGDLRFSLGGSSHKRRLRSAMKVLAA